MEKISIIIPVYNVSKYLKRCLDSVINQTYKNIEIIIVNDGSTDDSLKICESYQKKDKRIIIINQKNQGLSAARNKGLNIANGKYICFIDSDDYVFYDYVLYLYRLIKKDNYDFSSCNSIKIINNKQFKTNIKEKKYILNSKTALKMLFNNNNNFSQSAWGKLYKKELFKNIKYPVGKVYEDIETTGNIILKSKKIIYSTLPKYNYCIRNDSISFKKYNINDLDRINNAKALIDKTIKRFPDLKKYATCFYINNLIAICNKQLFSNIYISNEIKEAKKIIRKNIITILFNKTYPLVKKLQLILFLFNVKAYKKIYLIIKKDNF